MCLPTTEKPVTLTRRQRDVLAAIREHIETRGIPPTRAEIANRLGFRSVNAAEDHLRALVRKGVISLAPGTSRGIQLLGPYRCGLPVIKTVSSFQPILSDSHIETRLQLDPALFAQAPDFLYRMHDTSMSQRHIIAGDLIAIHRTPSASNGQVVLVRLNQCDFSIKQYFMHGANKVELRSAHPDFAPIFVDPHVIPFAIEGISVGVLRQHTTTPAVSP